MIQKEKVLCIQRERLPLTWVAEKTMLPMDLQGFIDQCSRSGYAFVNRSEAEKDPSLKQVIPYIVLQTQDLKKTAVYNRQGSEKRLHDLWSLGIGGHINPVDQENGQTSFKNILISGMERELDEELIQRPGRDQAQFSGIISEDITGVGSVHLGAVFRILTQTPHAYLPGPELFQFQWTRSCDLPQLRMELWSELALGLIASS